MRNTVNFVAFQFGWFACALGAAHDRPWLGPLVVACLVGLQWLWDGAKANDLRLLAISGVLGAVVDVLHRELGSVRFAGVPWLGLLDPPWMIALWVNFGSILEHSVAWLKPRLLAAALFGAVGGPLSYLAGERIGALQLGENRLLSLVVLAVSWGLITPLLFCLARTRPSTA